MAKHAALLSKLQEHGLDVCDGSVSDETLPRHMNKYIGKIDHRKLPIGTDYDLFVEIPWIKRYLEEKRDKAIAEFHADEKATREYFESVRNTPVTTFVGAK